MFSLNLYYNQQSYYAGIKKQQHSELKAIYASL